MELAKLDLLQVFRQEQGEQCLETRKVYGLLLKVQLKSSPPGLFGIAGAGLPPAGGGGGPRPAELPNDP